MAQRMGLCKPPGRDHPAPNRALPAKVPGGAAWGRPLSTRGACGEILMPGPAAVPRPAVAGPAPRDLHGKARMIFCFFLPTSGADVFIFRANYKEHI